LKIDDGTEGQFIEQAEVVEGKTAEADKPIDNG
jgi:hypothetical protein